MNECFVERMDAKAREKRCGNETRKYEKKKQMKMVLEIARRKYGIPKKKSKNKKKKI